METRLRLNSIELADHSASLASRETIRRTPCRMALALHFDEASSVLLSGYRSDSRIEWSRAKPNRVEPCFEQGRQSDYRSAKLCRDHQSAHAACLVSACHSIA